MNLSKSKYCLGIQCKKLLWLKQNKPEEQETTGDNSSLNTGIKVGEEAKKLFGSYINIEYKDLMEMVEETKQVIKEHPTCVITEASFSYENNFCSVDILKKKKDHYEIYEVKSSTVVEDIYLEDASYQYYVLTSLGYLVDKVSIVHLNKQYVRKGSLDIQKLFKIEDITSIAKEKLKEVKQNIQEINAYMDISEEREESLEDGCQECPYFSYCTRDLEKPNIFQLHGMQNNTKFSMLHKGIYTYKDLLETGKINEKCLEQIDFELNNREPKIDKEKIKDFLNTLSYPLYFLDFETIDPAIPEYDDSIPYEKIPFQYSLHILEEPNKQVEHREFLGYPDEDPRRALAEQLVQDIPMNVCTLAYNMRFEKEVIKRLAEIYPDLKDHLMNIYENIKDLMLPFKNRDYYVKDMFGSYSIKYVLPALFPDDPSLNYHNLNEVHNGVEAMDAFTSMKDLSKEEQEEMRQNLLKYCGLDTYAMVKIHEKLLESIKI